MKIEIKKLTEGKKGAEEVAFEGTYLPAGALQRLLGAGYEYVRYYPESRTFALWGKTVTACLTEEQIRAR